MFHRMCAVVSFVIPILETLAARLALPALLYLREVAEDGSVLAGVELELPTDGIAAVPRRKFFWCASWAECLDAYDQAALQAIAVLQSMYGFVVRDYNYSCMMTYRDSLRSAVRLAVCAARHASCSRREVPSGFSAASVSSGNVALLDWNLVCSRLMASVRYI